ncbi:hypothetical protein RFI_32674 [Reticulomyxa filosa]|uniref:EF-hand domain-containing protein n=1 Tax=Reticulomyxa filosa TaxID=46433 RepID=X6LUA3_RETFI|nr:hypothetical protein RFI_32674 [Reticulomyxa filosa]|eukprot:ETO04722.1 hypothetical protein RFI_32674 [Reticulomyxa filosa]
MRLCLFFLFNNSNCVNKAKKSIITTAMNSQVKVETSDDICAIISQLTGSAMNMTSVITVEIDILLVEKLKAIDIAAINENRNKLIGKDEFINILSPTSSQHIFAKLDTNNDENVSPQEYTRW